MRFTALVVAAVVMPAFAQFEPESAHVRLYLPQIADGGPPDNQWQTVLTFMNPSFSTPADVSIAFFSNDGKPLPLDFGEEPSVEKSFSMPPQAVRIYRSKAGKIAVTGWAMASASIPIQGVASFRRYENGIGRLEVADQSAVRVRATGRMTHS